MQLQKDSGIESILPQDIAQFPDTVFQPTPKVLTSELLEIVLACEPKVESS